MGIIFIKETGMETEAAAYIECMPKKTGGREMDIDDLIYGDSDPGPSDR